MVEREMDPKEGTSPPGVHPGETERDPTARERRDDRSVVELVRELANEGADLVRQEVALARTEMREKAESYQRAATSIAIGGALLFAALLTLLWAVNLGLTALFAQWMGLDIAAWLAPVVLAVVLGAVGYALLKGGQSTMREEGLTPEKSKESLQADRSWARARAKQFRERVRHE